VPLEGFFVGPGRTVLEDGELITGLVLPRPQPGSAFFKIGRVAADIAKASGSAMIVRDGDRVGDCRMAFGSVAPTPMRARSAERVLIGRVFGRDLVEKAAEVAASEVAPIDDVRSLAWYRRDAVRALASDALNRAWQRAGSPEPLRIDTPAGRTSSVTVPAQSIVHSLPAGEKRWIDLSINGEKRQVWVGANDLLLNVLREQLQLTGSKYGCGIGECSACTVQIDGQPVLSCLVLAVSAIGREILTVEGLRKANGQLDPLQDAFLDAAAYQCGYCTPGMLMTAKSLLAERPRPDESEVRHYLRGNLCRCTGYARIVRAVLNCAEGATGGQ
jgi:carbon-monoxide dehydrogenase small subunit